MRSVIRLEDYAMDRASGLVAGAWHPVGVENESTSVDVLGMDECH